MAALSIADECGSSYEHGNMGPDQLIQVEYDIDGIHRVHGVEVSAVPGMFDQDHEVG